MKYYSAILKGLYNAICSNIVRPRNDVTSEVSQTEKDPTLYYST